MSHVITTPLPNIFENQWSKPDEFDELLERLKKFTLAVCLNKDTLISFYSVLLQVAPKMWTKNGIIGKIHDSFKNGTEYYNQPSQDAIASYLAALQRDFGSREASPAEGVTIGRKRKSSPPQNQIVKEQRTENGRHEAGTPISVQNVAPNGVRNNTGNRFVTVAASLIPGLNFPGNLLPIISDDPAQRNEDLRQMHLILDDRYLFLNGIEGTFFYACFDLRTKMELICRPNENTAILDRASVMEGHQHINQIVAVVHKPSRVYVFYKQLKNDLLSYIRQKHKIHEIEAKDIFRQIVQIVIDCHAKGIVLRDLKMKKFYFDQNDPKRIKFESLEDAILLENKDDDKLLLRRGCIVYIAPEILQVSQTYRGKPADIWSLGVGLYTLVVGRYPFNDIDHRQLVTKIAAANYTIPSFVSSRCADLIRSMLAYDPKDRISAEHILNHDWFKVEDELFTPSVDDQLVPDSNPALSPVHGDHF